VLSALGPAVSQAEPRGRLHRLHRNRQRRRATLLLVLLLVLLLLRPLLLPLAEAGGGTEVPPTPHPNSASG